MSTLDDFEYTEEDSREFRERYMLSHSKISIPVYFTTLMVAQSGNPGSPSASKPQALVEKLLVDKYPIKLRAPTAVTREDLYRAHDKNFVDGVLDCKRQNGFGNYSPKVAASLPWTSGAMYDATLAATANIPTVAPVSGFHHACYAQAMGFCTFNGLMVTALKLKTIGKTCAIIDCDMHYGNGTDNIIERTGAKVYHQTFGKYYGGGMSPDGKYPEGPKYAAKYLKRFEQIEQELAAVKPDVILYQAGADVHVDDPAGGVLNTEQMYQRDIMMFTIAKKLGIPLCWNLAGGYQIEPDGSIPKVLELHLNTFKAALHVYKA